MPLVTTNKILFRRLKVLREKQISIREKIEACNTCKEEFFALCGFISEDILLLTDSFIQEQIEIRYEIKDVVIRINKGE